MATHYELLVVREDRDGKKRWTKIGAMFPQREGDGFVCTFDALPMPGPDGCRVIARPPRDQADRPQRSNRYNDMPEQRGRQRDPQYDERLDDSVPF